MMNRLRVLFGIITLHVLYPLMVLSNDSHENECMIAYEDMCYKLFLRETGDDAEINCINNNQRLAIIKNADMAEYLSKHMRSFLGSSTDDSYTNRFWIGLKRIELISSTEWIFNDGSYLSTYNYSNWYPTQPDESDSYSGNNVDCVSMSAVTKLWFDDSCNYNTKPYICEYKGSCNIGNVFIPHAEFDSCYSDKIIESGRKLKIQCLKGFHLQGENYIKCFANGTWTRFPKCVRGCPDPISVPHASLTGKKMEYLVGESATYVCEDGHYSSNNIFQTDFTVYCNSDSNWSKGYRCILRNKYANKEIILNPLLPTNLPCIVDEGDGNLKQWLWLRNSENINHINSSDNEESTESIEAGNNNKIYFIDDSGTLTINEISETTVGVYICFAVGRTMIPGNVTYNVKIPEDCSLDNSNILDQRTVNENDSLLLQCPHQKKLYSSSWFKNGYQLFSTDEIILFEDGSLFFPQIDVTHGGQYECRIESKSYNCTGSLKINVGVYASARSACGYYKNKDDQPWLVSLWWKDETLPFCYGIFIHENWVLTTAHCLSGIFRKKVLDIFVRFAHDSDKHSSVTRDFTVSKVKIHPMFSKKLYVNDIGLVKLKEKVSFTPDYLPLCLSAFDFTIRNPCDQFFSLDCLVSGWGALEKDSIDHSSVLTESMTVLPLSECQSCNCDSTYSHKILCAVKKNDTSPNYAGDSGSPLIIESEGRMYLLGIYSWGERMSQLGLYDYFTKVSMYIPWIESYINSN